MTERRRAMANAAPYIAGPMRRLLAGAVDLLLICVLVVVLLALSRPDAGPVPPEHEGGEVG